MQEGLDPHKGTAAGYAVKAVLLAALAGAVVGVVAGSVMAMRTVLLNVMGFTLDGFLVGLYLALVYGLLYACGGAVVGVVFAGARALGRTAGSRTVFAAAFGIILSLYIFLTVDRLFNQGLYYYRYSFIHSYRGMQVFCGFRMILGAALAITAGYIAYRLGRRRPVRLMLGLVLIITVAALAVGLRSRQPQRQTATQLPVADHRVSVPSILLIGWDGANWAVMDRLITAGQMPNTREIIRRGARGDLKTIPRTVSPDIWTTIYTGKSKFHHGIYGFDYYTIPGISRPVVPPWRGLGLTRILFFAVNHNLIDLMIANRSVRRATPIWCIMNMMGRTAGVVGPLATWPAEPVDPLMITTTAGDVAGRVRRGEIDRQAFLQGELYYPSQLDGWAIEAILANERWRGCVGPGLYRKYRPDFFTIYFPQPDGAQHKNWMGYEPQYYPEATQEELGRYVGVIENEYILADSILGELLEVAGDTTNIMIVSDHGFSPAYRNPFQQAGHYYGPDGILIAYGPSIVPGARVPDACVYDITPTLLTLAGIPVAEDMQGRVLEEMIRTEFLERHPVRIVATYETGASGMQVRRSQAEKEVYQKLKALGYLAR